MLSKEQISDWVDHPVTKVVAEFFKKEHAGLVGTPAIECLVFGEPQKTQENLIDLVARKVAMEYLMEFLEGDFDESVEESDE
jgi:hypothetical protein